MLDETIFLTSEGYNEEDNKPKKNSEKRLFKFKMKGDSGVGKSCVLLRYTDNSYTESYISTIGVDFKIGCLEIDGEIIKTQVWDTAGQESFRTIPSNYDSGHHVVIVVFDLTDEVSFNNAKGWVKETKEYVSDPPPIILVGNKCDLTNQRVINKTTKVEEYVKQEGIKYYIETSAKTGHNVRAVFELASRVALNH